MYLFISLQNVWIRTLLLQHHYYGTINSKKYFGFLKGFPINANVLSSVSSVVCLQKILILHLPYPIHVHASCSIY